MILWIIIYHSYIYYINILYICFIIICRENEEHIDPHSYSWCMMRLAMVKHVLHSMNSFLSLIGQEPAGKSVISELQII